MDLSSPQQLSTWLNSPTQLGQWQPILSDDSTASLDDSVHVLVFNSETLAQDVLTLVQSAAQRPTAIAALKPHTDLALAYVLKYHGDLSHIKSTVSQCTLNAEIAVFSQAPSLLEPGLLVMDMDSTAIQIECIDEIARLAGVYDEVAAVTQQAMQGQLAFSDSLRQRVAKLAGVELNLLNQLKEDLPLMPGVFALCQALKQANWTLAIASGGFVPFAQKVQSVLGLDRIHANELGDDGDKLTGEVHGDIVDADEKARFLTRYAQELGLAKSQTMAMGDGANDLVMMAASGLGVAVHGKPKVVAEADVAINHGSLLQVLYFLSVPK